MGYASILKPKGELKMKCKRCGNEERFAFGYSLFSIIKVFFCMKCNNEIITIPFLRNFWR